MILAKANEILERIVWVLITPIFPFVQRFLLRVKIIQHTGRQPYLMGTLLPGIDLRQVKKHLKQNGFGNHFIAWQDTDQLLSWRKRVSFNEQYHIRIFKGGEVRGHYEFTPEGHPIKHFFEVGQQPKREEFMKFLGSLISPASPDNVRIDAERYHREHGFK